MNTKIVYCDESGDDGCNTSSGETFILTTAYMPGDIWNENYHKMKLFRGKLKEAYGFPVKEEMHLKAFITDKKPYRCFNWTNEQKLNILKNYTYIISSLNIKIINVLIDKAKIMTPDYRVLENALTYNIQRIENDSNGDWNYLVITDKGRISPMRKTARAIRAFNPIHSNFGGYINRPIKNLIEDILEKDSKESYFIQICDFVSYFVNLYYKCCINAKELPSRVKTLFDVDFVTDTLNTFKENNIFNLKANSSNEYGIVIYPK